MENKSERIIFHIDVNSAFLSWTAINLLRCGESEVDIRKIPSIIGGSIEDRRGVVLAKSIPAKKFNIITGEPIVAALKKCPQLKVYPPEHKLYTKFSNDMYKLLKPYSDFIERYSIDEVFMEASHFKYDYMEKAKEIKRKIEKDLGFTVNIGIGNNKLLAKMASDFSKKNSIHTLFKEEIRVKMWPLKVGDLFMVGKAAEKKLIDLNIFTIGDLANYNLSILRNIFKSYANIIYEYANGIDDSPINCDNYVDVKGIGNSTTTSKDILSIDEALKVLLSLTESVAKRLRANKSLCGIVAVSIKSNVFTTYSHQKKLLTPTDSTEEIFNLVKAIFKEMWRGEPIRLLGVRVTKLSDNSIYQKSLFDDEKIDKQRSLDSTIDKIREKYGDSSIIRSTFISSNNKKSFEEEKPEDYLMMGGLYDSFK
ncbi:DNA polymerase IV [uncultured Clostridium sp.]|uniref:Y-family DNA polymerase n=1 Tax=uncultured Clostridium sp. TaxID=59620 RepID=UPI003216E652